MHGNSVSLGHIFGEIKHWTASLLPSLLSNFVSVRSYASALDMRKSIYLGLGSKLRLYLIGLTDSYSLIFHLFTSAVAFGVFTLLLYLQ